MAFTDTQKAQIRRWLGWSGRYFQTDSQLEQALLAIAAETQLLVEAEITNLTTIDAALSSSSLRTHFKAEQVGSITLQGADELELLRSQGRQAVGRIAAMLGVEVRHDAFAGAAPSRPGANYLMQG